MLKTTFIFYSHNRYKTTIHLASKTTYKIYNIHKLHQSAPPQASGRQDPRGCPLRGWPHARHRGAARVSLPEWKYLSNSGIVFLFHSCNIRFVWDLWSQSKFHDMCSGVIPLASSTLKQTMTTAMDMRLWCIVKNKLQIIDIASTMMPCNYNHLTRDMRLMVLITIILYTCTLLV